MYFAVVTRSELVNMYSQTGSLLCLERRLKALMKCEAITLAINNFISSLLGRVGLSVADRLLL